LNAPNRVLSDAPSYQPFSSAPGDRTLSGRIASIDVLRGLAVVLMAIDHVRVYSGVPAGGPDPGVFFTRWITHFVAPVFVFLAGTAAFLYGDKIRNQRALSTFLATRGLLLVLLELTVIRVSWTFNFDYATYMLAGVIWVIGWSMVVLAALVHLSTRTVAAIGLVTIVAHNLLPALLGPMQGAIVASGMAWLFKLLYFGEGIQFGANGPTLAILYTLIPWVGVMAAGYGFGALYRLEPARRRRLLYQIGGAAVVLFVVLRFTDVYGDPRPWRAANPEGAWPSVRSFLNTAKYPASLSFLLMTLGPAILLLPSLERAHNGVTRVLAVFGRVPMFYYLLHIPLIHVLACVVSVIRTGRVTPWLFGNHPLWPAEQPAGYRWSLALLYLVTAVAVTLLYFACRWYARVKETRPHAWMRYV
jgi:uncharacterized membrane protein